MSATDGRLRDRVISRTIGIPGRSLNSARSQHFVIDEPPHRGGPGEALTPVEAFLAGISACGVLLVQSYAGEMGIPLAGAICEIEGVRDRAHPAEFEAITLRFALTGPDPEQARQLVGRYQER